MATTTINGIPQMSGFDYFENGDNFTGVVYWGSGAKPFTASLHGKQLVTRRNTAREFKTAEAAMTAIKIAQG